MMKKTFSRKWISSKQPRKQRKYVFNAPLHIRQKMMGARLSEKLSKEFMTRTLPVRKGDKVVVLRGSFRKVTGQVTKVDLSKCRIYIDSVKRKKVSGQEVHVPIHPSNVMITEISRDDKKRQKIIERRKKK